MARRLVTLLGFAAIAVLGPLALGAPACAHSGGRAEHATAQAIAAPVAGHHAAPGKAMSPSTAAAWFLLAAAIAAVPLRRTRRVVVVALALVLLVFAFQSALHSVHHLGAEQATRCVVASAAIHLSALDCTAIALGAPALRLEGPVPELAPRVWPAGPLRPVTGRAPPSA